MAADYCCFVKEAGRLDIERLAADGDGLALFRKYLHPKLAALTDAAVWANLRPDSPADASNPYDPAAYLFQCLACGEHVI